MSKKKVNAIELNMENFKTGTLRRNEGGFGFVNIGENEEEIHISEKNMLKALDGDQVLIKLEKKVKGKRQEGKIIKILDHSVKSIVGTFIDNKSFGFVVPDKKMLSSDIFISKKYFGGAKTNDKVIVKITKYADEKTNKSEGKVVEVLGNINDLGVDILSIVKEYKVPYEFPKKVLEETKKIKQKIDQEDIKNRVDIRNREIFTIDGEDAKDLDDAVEVKKNKDGTYELGVHIADVSYYVRDNMLLNKEAIARGTSIYMLDRVIPMLPKELSNGICSLNEGKDRFALSCIMTIDKYGNVVDKHIQKSVICVTRRMNYHDVNNLYVYDDIKNKKINKKDIDEEELKKINESYKEYKDYYEHFLLMKELKNVIKKRRIRNGFLDLNIPETKIEFDEEGKVSNIKKYDFLESNEVIEHFMLTANESVAEFARDNKLPFIYRIHEIPDIDKVLELNEFLATLGYRIENVNGRDENSIKPLEFEKVLEKIKGEQDEKVISTFILRTLRLAKYSSENKGHFGIGSDCYCHFTSPIRRYPDLFIHRILSDYLKNNNKLDQKTKEKYETETVRYSETSSEAERNAQLMERDANKLKMCEYMENFVGEEFDGIISSVTPFGIFVELENTVEGLIRIDYLGTEYLEYDERKRELYGKNSNKRYRIGDKIRIKVFYASKVDMKIDFVEAGSDNFIERRKVNVKTGNRKERRKKSRNEQDSKKKQNKYNRKHRKRNKK